MKKRPKGRSLTAAALLAALLLPGATVLLLAAHVLFEHHHSPEDTSADDPWHSPGVRAVLEHGHDHEAGAPAHDHAAVRRSDRGASSAADLLPGLPGLEAPILDLTGSDHRSGWPAVRPEATARGAPRTLSLLCTLLI